MKHIVKSAFFITAGGALPLLASVILLIPYTDNLHTGDYGTLAIYISFALLVQILMNYGVDSYLSVHYYDHHEDPVALRSFLSGITGGLLLYGLALTALLSLAGMMLFPLIFPDGNISFWPYGFMSIVTGFFNAWFRMYVNIQVYADRARKYFWFGVFNLVVTVAISAWLVYANPYSLIGPMWGRLISGVLIFALTFAFGLRDFGLRFQLENLRDIRKYSTPIVVFSLLTWVLGYINNYILNALATPEDVGVYDFALKCTLVIEYAGLGLLGTISPRVYKIWKQNGGQVSNPEVNRLYHAYSALNILLIAINIAILPVIIRTFIHNEGYYACIILLPILCVSYAFKGLYGILVNPILYFKRTTVLPRVMTISALLQILSGVILTHYFGLWGAVWSFFVIRPIQVFLMWIEIRRSFVFQFNVQKIIVAPVLYSAIVILLQLLLPEKDHLWLPLTQCLAAILLILFYYRNEIKSIPALFIGDKQ